MEKLQVNFYYLEDAVILQDGSKIPVIRKFDYPFLVWGRETINFLMEAKLRKLFRRSSHPSVNRLIRTLGRVGQNDAKHRIILDQITLFCKSCQKNACSPGRLKFVLKNDRDFSHPLIIDVMCINNDPILHVVDGATYFQAARWLSNMSAIHLWNMLKLCWLSNMSAIHLWNMLKLCWIDIYIGPPEVIVHGTGTNFDSAEFRQSASNQAIKLKCVPIEAPQSVGLVERYHGPLRRKNLIIT
ncbi:hypothetical protein EV44_g3438 [Erysiphe necator]|uniref:Integrase catalytic domain-containing protein n=1 Tax=Uncinula necator TaxID=52586 RepID=A0A0B1P2Y4_UNCNE|nr:hypothetical protein EV44_g3438 [Erysiphe necator]